MVSYVCDEHSENNGRRNSMRNNCGNRIRSERSRLKTWNYVLGLSEIACSVYLLDR